jgi:kynurenine formamidase
MKDRGARWTVGFVTLGLIGTAGLLGCARPADQKAARSGIDETKIVDLTYPFDSTTVYWPTAEPFRLEVAARGRTPSGYWYASNNICASEHGGTHLDAPIHFAEGGWTTEAIPVDRLVGPAVVVDVTDSCAANPDYRLSVADLERWELLNGRIPDGAIVLMRAGWGSRWPDRKRYFQTETPQDAMTLHFPGYSKEAAEFLTRERRVDAVGLDTPSLDHGPSRDFIAHQIFGAANVPGLENVARLEELPERGATIIALPMKIAGGTGGPCRVIAVLP